ncbi:hypothetical protein [Arthrobacter sp. Br18]|uniref:hypothetical protein n=1 Tax=Arthrobacter sp. Br18 TaxID=1312954 RepID=UPI00047E10D1|nr:hypothetical protein [Arthrobacter sp. Br18]
MTKQQAEQNAGRAGGSSTDPAQTRSTDEQRLLKEHRPTGPYGPSNAVAGPFTLREAVFGGAVALVFLGTLLPFFRDTMSYQNFWTISPLFYVGIGILLPVAAAALVAARRLGTATLRVGSLSVDQFAAVSAVLASVFFFLETVMFFSVGALVSLIGALGMLVATALAPHLPPLNKDFKERPVSEAHLVARPVLAARPKAPKPPKALKPVPAEKVEQWSEPRPAVASQPDKVHSDRANPAKQYGEKVAGLVGKIRAGAGPKASRQEASSLPEERDVVRSAAPVVGASAAGATAAPAAGASAAGATAASGATGASATGATAAPAAGASAAGATAASGATGADDLPARGAGAGSSTPDAPAPTTQVADTAASGTAPAESVSAEPRGAEQHVSWVDPPHDAAATEARTPLAETRAHTVVTNSGPVRQDPISATRDPEEDVVEAFWFAVGTPRVVVDEQTGRAVFTLEPGDWEVGIEDRGNEFLVQDKRTGHVGILRDLSNIERAPKD